MITQLINSNGRAVANQFIITKKDRITFQSYESIICHKMNNGEIVLDSYYWDYSATTLRHLKNFLNISLSKKEIQKLIDNGTYKTRNLNRK